MAREIKSYDLRPILEAAEQWINRCLIGDGSIFSAESLWKTPLIDEIHRAVVEHPDEGPDDFATKLQRQLANCSPSAQQLLSEMLWALLLFPSNTHARTKRQQVCDTWAFSQSKLDENHPLLSENVLRGVGSGGMGFNAFKYFELSFLIEIA